ncbi:MAG TPA: DUF4097 family beta strand repeat-containing protein, partial [Pyrinomonadaceae bacterium]|nr:DUF4097 family beta strand repeat-containing protein [Pyrinomonadaceae bacterium]
VTHAQDGQPLSPAASLEGQPQRIMVEGVRVDVGDEADRAQVAAEAAAARARIDSQRIAREAQRQVDQSMREAQREIEVAQREMTREQVRTQKNVSRSGRGAGIGVGAGGGVGVGRGTSWRVTSQETRSFSVSTSPRVTINTYDGKVTVRGWDKSEVSYTATKHANDEESLKRITVQAEQQGQTISIAAIDQDGEENGSVDFDVYVPRQSSLHVSSGDGALNLDGVSGQITLRSGDGPIQVANGGGQLEVNTGDGRIQIIKFEGQVDARTGDGEIALDGNFNSLSARTGDGPISLTVPAGSSFTIETNTPEEINNEGFVVAEDVTISPRVKRWRIGNGGKVFILRTGEGRILLRPRQ